MGAQLPARWLDGSKRLVSMPNSTMDRLEGAVAGQLQCLVRRRGALDWLIGHVGRIEFNDMSAGILNGK